MINTEHYALNTLYFVLALLITLPIATVKFYSKKNLPGILFCVIIALFSHILGQIAPVAGGAVIGILLGMIIASFLKPGRLKDTLTPGIKETSKRMLQCAVALLGFQMNFNEVAELGLQSIALIVVVIFAALLAAFFAGKLLKAADKEKTLIGIGTAICGGSAIAAASPVIKASDKEIATSIATIFLFNVTAIFIFPAIGNLIGMSDVAFGMWAGSAINDTSSVVTAAYAYSAAAGDVATVVKLFRALMIIPVTFSLGLIQAKKDSSDSKFDIRKALPWFVIAFLLASIVNTTGFIPNNITVSFGNTSRFLIILALTAIGLSTNLKEIIKNGGKSLLLGFVCSVTIAVCAYLLIFISQV